MIYYYQNGCQPVYKHEQLKQTIFVYPTLSNMASPLLAMFRTLSHCFSLSLRHHRKVNVTIRTFTICCTLIRNKYPFILINDKHIQLPKNSNVADFSFVLAIDNSKCPDSPICLQMSSSSNLLTHKSNVMSIHIQPTTKNNGKLLMVKQQ